MLASSSVTLVKEQYSFSYQDLIADVGGVLGLFIGLNFLQICEVAVIWFRKYLVERNIFVE